ncbi:MAG: hypothetical protein M1829_004213 [Trizodia sp. TS-e1964]|nr:MAG: hypothetical protein M1829_004213 [Trizodia sp. TS-e1964]
MNIRSGPRPLFPPPDLPAPREIGMSWPISQKIYAGTFIYCKDLKTVDIANRALIGVNAQGKIAFFHRSTIGHEDVIQTYGEEWRHADYVAASNVNQFFFPGFVDTHIHAPQYPNVGLFGKTTLLNWLVKYTFPLESSFRDTIKAEKIYAKCVTRTLTNGTTTAAYYATIHVPSTNLLADICLIKGQRAFIGRVCMDKNPDAVYYSDPSPLAAIGATNETIEHIKKIHPAMDLICPIITPRFAPGCTGELLRRLGALHKETGLLCQTHLAENLDELALVRHYFPTAKSYTELYDSYGLLTSKTILAHCIHIDTADLALIKARGAGVSHCPTSNTALSSGAARIRLILDAGVPVGLGTDVSGGYAISMLESIRQAILVSSHVSMKHEAREKLAFEEALYMATRGGAKLLGLEDRIGAFEVGMDWDAQLIGLDIVGINVGRGLDHGPVDVFGWETFEDMLAKWVFGGDDRNTRKVWVKGRLVHQR